MKKLMVVMGLVVLCSFLFLGTTVGMVVAGLVVLFLLRSLFLSRRIRALIKALEDEDWRVRCRAARALGEISSAAKDAVPALVGVLKDENEDVRYEAACVLGNIGDESASEALGYCVKSDKAKVVKAAAKEAIAKIKSKSLTEKEKLERMRKRVRVGIILCLIFVIPAAEFIFLRARFQKRIAVGGILKWRYEPDDRVRGAIVSSPAIGWDGTIYVGSLWDGYLYAINPDGTLKWRHKPRDVDSPFSPDIMVIGGALSSPAIGSDGTIYIGWRYEVSQLQGDWDTYHYCYLYAMKPDGTLKWRYKIDGGSMSSPAIGWDGTIYVGSGGSYDLSRVYGFEVGKVIAYSYLYAIKPDGTLKWRYKTEWRPEGKSEIGDEDEVEILSSPVVGLDGTIYVGSLDGFLYAISPEGTSKWCYDTELAEIRLGGGLEDHAIVSSPAIGSDGTIYVGSLNGYLHAINPNGTLKWCYETGVMIRSSPAIGSDGTIYVGTGGEKDYYSYEEGDYYEVVYPGYLYAIKPDGTLKWRYKIGVPIESDPTIDSDGTIYVGADDGCLYAIQGRRKLANTPWPIFGRDLRHTGRAGKGGFQP